MSEREELKRIVLEVFEAASAFAETLARAASETETMEEGVETLSQEFSAYASLKDEEKKEQALEIITRCIEDDALIDSFHEKEGLLEVLNILQGDEAEKAYADAYKILNLFSSYIDAGYSPPQRH